MVSVIIGLGNIGDQYAGSRHNLGFDLLNLLCKKWNLKPKPGKGDYSQAEKKLDGHLVRLIWPTTLMNNSGTVVSQVLTKYNLTAENILILYDDLHLPLGRIRIRTDGADGGHNGMSSIIHCLETESILRLRMGIGPLPPDCDQIEFVLGIFSVEEREICKKMLDKAGEAVLYLLKGRPEKAMSLYNKNPAPGSTD